ncbi:MAG: hypothetical protein LUI10_01990 [Lachnospiraceae bacterium]|nr:hypothetical protein [Lachnospiraceae bacterium]
MLTVSEFAKAEPHKVTESTVIGWIKNNYVGGAIQKDGEWLIPNDARKPYTKNRIQKKSKRDAVINSILTGLNENYSVFPGLYSAAVNDCQSVFDGLLEMGYIKTITLSCDVQYYDITVKGIEFLNKRGIDKTQLLKELLVAIGKIADAVKAGFTFAEKLMPA